MKQIVFCLSIICLLVSGCASLDLNEAQRNIENSKSLRIGMTKAQVIQVMGPPLQNESYNKPNLWYYYVKCRWRDGMRTQDECMPLVFNGGKLIGWGKQFVGKMQLEHEFTR